MLESNNIITNKRSFTFEVDLSKDEFERRLSRQFNMQRNILGGFIGRESSIINLKSADDKIWSPQLQIRVESKNESHESVIVKGFFGLKSSIWVLFIFLYTLGGTIFFFFAMIWVVQIRLNIDSSLIIWAWIGLAILIGTFVFSKIVDKKAKSEIDILKDFMNKIIRDELQKEIKL